MSNQLNFFDNSGSGKPSRGSRHIPTIPLGAEAQRRYLNYALSVITSRALPDVRDGLKPVQRRILFDMFHDLHLTQDARFRKCAAVVGDVLGKYHPHGDSSVYDALVRMAQDFSLRYPLVQGHGNFGSLDGDSAAAMRYTECRLQGLASELLAEIKQHTVDWRASYDGTRQEPVVVPARLPLLLINGAQGIAVGMATSIPPHNLGEVVDAAIALIDTPALEVKDLLRHVKGPDFPTGGQLLTSRSEMRTIYETGQGSIKLQGEWKAEEETHGRATTTRVIVSSIPYGPTKSTIIQQIGDIIIARKLPQLLDVRDESTRDVRIVLELKKGTDPQVVMAYLFRHTPLQVNVQVNLTCLVPTTNPEAGAPERLDLKKMLQYFLDFRVEVVSKRLRFELEELRSRIHLLEGFAKIYDAIDETIRIIRKSEGKADAAQKLRARFDLDEEQAEAILETKLYKIARLEILTIQQELAAKIKEARRIEALLRSPERLWALVKNELSEIRERYGDRRRTKVGGAEALEFDPTAYIVHEDANVIISRDGWVKRVKELRDVHTTRTREGDEVALVLGGDTKEPLVFFTNLGSAYVCRINDVPPSSGYGDPVQKLFKFKDGERVVAAFSLDPRVRPPEEYLLAITRRGFGLRFTLAQHSELSTRTGRHFAKVGADDEVVGVKPVRDDSIVILASEATHVLQCRAGEINVLANPGKGVTAIKLGPSDRVLGYSVDTAITLETNKNRQVELSPEVRSLASRGGKGRAMWQREQFVRLLLPPPTLPHLQPNVSDASTPPTGELVN